MSDHWYEIATDSDGIRIEFRLPPDRYWPPAVLRRQPLPAEQLRGRRVLLTGAGPVWMYAHAAATLTAAGAAEVQALGRGAPGQSRDATGSRCELKPAGGGENRALLTVQLRTEPPLAEATLQQLLQGPLAELAAARPRELCLTGRASVEAYARVTTRAVASGVEWITCWSPRTGLVVVFDRHGDHAGESFAPPQWLETLVPVPVSPVIIGVTGDPNVGKSVFSAVLDHYRERVSECAGWRLDCDGQSPTPPWYLNLVRQDAAEEARAAREAIKRPWTPQMEVDIAEQLVRLRRFFEVVVADLPGGNHKAAPPQRIPQGRERIFEKVDVLVLLDREDGGAETGWRDALRPHGLEVRLATVLRSRQPKGPSRLNLQRDGGLWRGIVEGLDRNRSTAELAAAFREPLDQLWPVLLEQGRAGQGKS